MSPLSKYFESEKYKILLNTIRDGNFLPGLELDDYYRAFSDETFRDDEYLKSTLFLAIRRYSKFQNLKLLSNHFKMDEDTLRVLLNADYKIASFPIVDNSQAELANLYVIELEDNCQTLSFPNTDMFRLDYLQNIKKALGKNFFVFFDRFFTGRSFGLALAACFFIKDEIREKLLFTGEVRADGRVYDVDGIGLKTEIAKANKRYLVGSTHVNSITELKYLDRNCIDVPFIQLFGKSKNELNKNFSKLKEFISDGRVMVDVLGFSDENLSVFCEDFIENNIDTYLNYLRDFYYKVKRVYEIDFEVNLHLLGSLSSFAFLMGLVLGAKKRFVIYHYQDGRVHKVFDFVKQSARVLKSKKNHYEYIKFQTFYNDPDSDELVVSLYIASHNPINDAANFAKEKLNCNMVEIRLKEQQGYLPLDNEKIWIDVVREIYSLLTENTLDFKNVIKKYHFIFSVPVPIAFALGMAIGDYKKILVYNFDKQIGSYIKVFDSDLKEELPMNAF